MKRQEMKELLDKLTHTFGPSGYEKQVRDLILETIKEYADEYKVDALGNLLVRKGTKKANGKRIMISAHMDEIGLMITHIDEDGFAYAAPIGGINPLNCVSARVVFENGVEGTVQTFEPRSTGRTPAMEKLYIDTGASSRETSKVNVGDPAVFVGQFTGGVIGVVFAKLIAVPSISKIK